MTRIQGSLLTSAVSASTYPLASVESAGSYLLSATRTKRRSESFGGLDGVMNGRRRVDAAQVVAAPTRTTAAAAPMRILRRRPARATATPGCAAGVMSASSSDNAASADCG